LALKAFIIVIIAIIHLRTQTQTDSYWLGWLNQGTTIDTPDADFDKLMKRGLLGTALHRASGRTTLSVFEASALADGPVAQLALPYGLPLGLHGQFVAV
jgi:hypothetical protein